MSQLPEIHVAALGAKLAPHGIVVEEGTAGLALRRKSDGKSYRFCPTEDGFALGTQVFYACRYFGLEPFEIVYG